MKRKVKTEAIKKALMVFINRENYIKVLALIGLIVLDILFADKIMPIVWSWIPDQNAVKAAYMAIGVLTGMLFRWKS